MPKAISFEEVIEQALERAFATALEQAIQDKAEALFQQAFSNGSPFSQKLEEKISEGFQRSSWKESVGRKRNQGSRSKGRLAP